MREIKFRAWDIESPMMMSWEEIQQEWVQEGYFWNLLGGDHYVPMQYTGLKDKNGKEIYEGDVVRFTSPCALPGDGTQGEFFYYEVEFSEGGFFPLQLFMKKETLEVIGNVHENPELLEDN